MTDYVFKAGRKDLAPLLLLHSTGGDEHQLVEIAEMIAPFTSYFVNSWTY
ncbi:hypothetical protein Llala01_02240 [Lactococcus lactis subsp. lactis]|nr:Carboxylesterase [Lactococcus lactis subsp. lactis]TDG87610.1 hypothetical protein C5L15_002583 [Lactococcus lactis subsp. lactis]SCW60162.1 phospholipase/carboxylesterase [Lactococcus lactis]